MKAMPLALLAGVLLATPAFAGPVATTGAQHPAMTIQHPTVMTNAQMDNIVAGTSPIDALVAASPTAFDYNGSTMEHNVGATLRFQPDEPNKGIAIPGGSNANFDNSVLRASGDPAYGAVVVLY